MFTAAAGPDEPEVVGVHDAVAAMRTSAAIVSNAKPSLNTSRKSSVIRRGSACSDSTPSSRPTPGSTFDELPGARAQLEAAGQRRVVEIARRAGPRRAGRRSSSARPSPRRAMPKRARNAPASCTSTRHVELRLLSGSPRCATSLRASMRPASLIERQPLDLPVGARRVREQLELAERRGPSTSARRRRCRLSGQRFARRACRSAAGRARCLPQRRSPAACVSRARRATTRPFGCAGVAPRQTAVPATSRAVERQPPVVAAAAARSTCRSRELAARAPAASPP